MIAKKPYDFMIYEQLLLSNSSLYSNKDFLSIKDCCNYQPCTNSPDRLYKFNPMRVHFTNWKIERQHVVGSLMAKIQKNGIHAWKLRFSVFSSERLSNYAPYVWSMLKKVRKEPNLIPAAKNGSPDHHCFWSKIMYTIAMRKNASPDVTIT